MNRDFRGALEEADAQMEHVRTCLLRPTPESIDSCRAALERAVTAFEGLLAHGQPPPGCLLGSLQQFQRAVRDNRALLDSAGHLYFGAIETAIVAAGLYDRHAAPAGLTPPGRLSVLV
jgi:hypothetical protein